MKSMQKTRGHLISFRQWPFVYESDNRSCNHNTKPSRFQAPRFIKCMSVCGVFLYWYHFCGAELKYSLPVYMIPQLSTLDRSTCTSNYQLETD